MQASKEYGYHRIMADLTASRYAEHLLVQHSATDLHQQWAGYQPFPSLQLFWHKNSFALVLLPKNIMYILLTRGVHYLKLARKINISY